MAMFIWEELRAHSIFSFRALFTILFPEFRIPIIFSTMILNIITSQVGNSSLVLLEEIIIEEHYHYKRLVSSFFSMSQMEQPLFVVDFQNKWSPMYFQHYHLYKLQHSV